MSQSRQNIRLSSWTCIRNRLFVYTLLTSCIRNRPFVYTLPLTWVQNRLFVPTLSILLPQLTDEVATLAARVDGHLKKMGAVWK